MTYENRELRVWKTREAAENNAAKTNREFAQVGLVARFVAIQQPNGWWTIAKVGA